MPRVRVVLTLDEAVDTAATGDVWLFRGRSLADRAIQTVTNSPVNHVGMAVALDDLPPLLWHAELGSRCPTCGPASASAASSSTCSATPCDLGRAVRPAGVGPAADRDGRAASRGPADGDDRAVRRTGVPTTVGLARQWAVGRVRRSSSLETIYCAELVAATLQHMGLLPDRRPASWYDPGRFWSGDRIALVPPFALGAEVPVTLGNEHERRPAP